MAWNGTGTFSRTNGVNTGTTVWAADKAAGVKIVSDRHDTHDQDLADGINACLAKNGENAATANLDLGGFKFTNAADGASDSDLASVGQTEKLSGRTTTYDFTSDANYTLTSAQEGYYRIVFTDTTPYLTASRTITHSTTQYCHLIQNNTLQSLTIKTSAGTGVPIAPGTSRHVLCDGTNIIEQFAYYPITTSGTSTAYTVTYGITAYDTYRIYSVDIDQLCGDSPTINFDSLGAKSIYYKNGFPVTSGALLGPHQLYYDGTNMVVLDPLHVTVDLSAASVDYDLQIGETAVYTFSSASSKALHITTGDEREYEMSVDLNTSDYSAGNYLQPNNTTYAGVFPYVNSYATAAGTGAVSASDNAFLLCDMGRLSSKMEIKTGKPYPDKVRSCLSMAKGVNATPNHYVEFVGSAWEGSTAWTSLGTLSFGASATTGAIKVTRTK